MSGNYLRWVVMAALVGMVGRAEGEEWGKKTWVYKKVGELEIKADVYRAGDEKTRPVVVWIHGGALINGHREAVSGKVMDWAKKSGYVLVSIDYRLAPESQLPLVVEDVQDAMKWIRKEGPKLFHADPAKLAVTGGSAGGYLTLTTGYRVQPAPSVLISFGATAIWSAIGTRVLALTPDIKRRKCPATRRCAKSAAHRLPTPVTALAMAVHFINIVANKVLGRRPFLVGIRIPSQRNFTRSCL